MNGIVVQTWFLVQCRTTTLLALSCNIQFNKLDIKWYWANLIALREFKLISLINTTVAYWSWCAEGHLFAPPTLWSITSLSAFLILFPVLLPEFLLTFQVNRYRVTPPVVRGLLTVRQVPLRMVGGLLTVCRVPPRMVRGLLTVWRAPPWMVEGFRTVAVQATQVIIILPHRLLDLGTWRQQLGISEQIVFWVKEVSAEYIKGVWIIIRFDELNSLFNSTTYSVSRHGSVLKMNAFSC